MWEVPGIYGIRLIISCACKFELKTQIFFIFLCHHLKSLLTAVIFGCAAVYLTLIKQEVINGIK